MADLNDDLDIQNDYQLKIQRLEETIKVLRSEIQEIKDTLGSEITDLKNCLIDKDFESGIFVEKGTFDKLDKENLKLRKLLDEFYKKELQMWYKEVRSKVNEL